MAESSSIIQDIFTPFQDNINIEQDTREEIRNIVKEVERNLREIVTTLQVIHRTQNGEQISSACGQVRRVLARVRDGYEQLGRAVPAGHFYKYNDHWRFATQKLCFTVGLVVFLEKGFLVDKTTVAQLLGLDAQPTLHLDLEDYLMGLLQLASELSRFAVNSVTYGDFSRPLQISKFVAELNAGFRLLNLKNDALRKRFDALKYDVKKIEEVVYDLSLRGLTTGASDSN